MPLGCNTELVEDELALLFDDGQSDSEEYSLDSFEIYESSSALSFLLRLRTLSGCFLAFATCGLPLATCGLRRRRLLAEVPSLPSETSSTEFLAGRFALALWAPPLLETLLWYLGVIRDHGVSKKEKETFP